MSRSHKLLFPGVLALTLACQDGTSPTGPNLAQGGTTALARGGNATPLTVTPTALALLLPDATPASITARVQFVGTITAATSDAQCATVSPLSAPATKPPGSSVYEATFAVTPVAAGFCTITLTDKKGGRAQVTLEVVAPLTDRMAFVSQRAPNGQIFVREADGSVAQLTEDAAGARGPAVAPDGRIVYSASRDHNIELIIMDPNGGNQTRLTFDGTHGPTDIQPAVSADGNTIAFVSNRDGRDEIYRMGIDGSNPVRLTENEWFDSSPSFSADGARIVFSSHRDGNSDIYLIDADGSDETRLTSDAGEDSDPVFAPDGRIVFVSDRDGNQELYRMDADGSNQTRLTNTSANDFDPTFTPDGRLVFASNRDGDYDIYLLSPGGALVQLTEDDDWDGNPAF